MNKKDYEFSEKAIRTMFVDFKIPSYLQDLEKYCDELEKENKQLKEDLEVQKTYYGDVLYETKQELEKCKKGIYRACEMLEILEHAHRENLTREPLTQEQWKEYLLTNE